MDAKAPAREVIIRAIWEIDDHQMRAQSCQPCLHNCRIGGIIANQVVPTEKLDIVRGADWITGNLGNVIEARQAASG